MAALTRKLTGMIARTALLQRTNRHVSASVGEAVAMMDVDAGKYYVLDDAASFIWERLREPTSIDELLTDLQKRYEVTPERCEADVLPFLRDLHAKGLVVAAS
jgi:Coenzyme PQQ synthesis protein D (PqqD)